MATEQDLVSKPLSPEELGRLLSKATRVQGLGKVLDRERPDVKSVIEHLDARKRHLEETFKGGQLRGAFADEGEACRRLPELLQTGGVSILDLRGAFVPEGAQAATEPAEARRTPSWWSGIRGLLRSGR